MLGSDGQTNEGKMRNGSTTYMEHNKTPWNEGVGFSATLQAERWMDGIKSQLQPLMALCAWPDGSFSVKACYCGVDVSADDRSVEGTREVSAMYE